MDILSISVTIVMDMNNVTTLCMFVYIYRERSHEPIQVAYCSAHNCQPWIIITYIVETKCQLHIILWSVPSYI